MTHKADLNDMLLFMEVVDAGSFTSAAARLNLPKANLSRKISKLEQVLGVTLLERTTRTQNLTEAGSAYLQHCRQIQHEVDLAESKISSLVSKACGTLRVGVSVGVGHAVLKDVMGEFLEAYPDVKLELTLSNRRVDLIEEGYDLVIRVGELMDSRLVAKNLGEIRRRLYASPKYLQRKNLNAAFESVAGCEFLVMSSAQHGDSLNLTNGTDMREIRIVPRVRVDDFLILKQMLVDGCGIAILPDYMCRQEVAQNLLMPVHSEWEMSPVDLYALYPQHRQKLPKVSAFLTHIQHVFTNRLR
ncbi:LysR family transcriptional regulator [Microbulbifer sp. OS29]|uniref:LysR family transcriptional regulator n=1 Tax=Microbulbifer okhotskensis TaxID=2926617 RepID=A0A9X2EMS6_9GAMM|nr:LysR family transcriptional regulator [Microbulbifer okhotskensis]MCO1334465.1 LysR family transcriptional regulator [Microbulbifer okhotskensis]